MTAKYSMQFTRDELETISYSIENAVNEEKNEIAIESVYADEAKENIDRMASVWLRIKKKIEEIGS